MTVTITRCDPLANVAGDTTAPGVLSVERFPDLPAALASLRARGIPITAEHEVQFAAHTDTQFTWQEMVQAPGAVYMARVVYDLRRA